MSVDVLTANKIAATTVTVSALKGKAANASAVAGGGGGAPGNTPGADVVLYVPFDDDYSDHSLNGVAGAASGAELDYGIAKNIASGYFNNANTNYVELETVSTGVMNGVLDSDFSIRGWVRFESLPNATGQMIFSNFWNVTPQPSTFLLQIAGFTPPKFWLDGYDASGTYRTLWDSAFNPSINTWYYIEISRSGNSIYGFVDGVQRGATFDCTGITFGMNTNAAADWRLGNRLAGGTVNTKGWIDDWVVESVAGNTEAYTPPDPPAYDDDLGTGIINASMTVNPADKGTAVELTGGNLTYYSNAGYGSARATDKTTTTSGLVQWETTITVFESGYNWVGGVLGPLDPLTSYMGNPGMPDSIGFQIYSTLVRVHKAGSGTTDYTGLTIGAGDVFTTLLNRTTGQIALFQNGTHICTETVPDNSGDLYPGITVNKNALVPSCTVNYGGSAFQYPVF